jgi:hypothetical protein
VCAAARPTTSYLIKNENNLIGMKNIFNILIFIGVIILTCQACSYHWKKCTDIYGNSFWVRKYKTYQMQKEYEYQYIFNNWVRNKSYQKYDGEITTDLNFIRFDTTRFLLFDTTIKYKNIFNSGLILPQMLYCELDTFCRPPVEDLTILNIKSGGGWRGHTITIDYFEELTNLRTKPTQRKFVFWANPYTIRLNCANPIFLLELTNNNANKKTDLDTFIKGSSVTFFAFIGSMI